MPRYRHMLLLALPLLFAALPPAALAQSDQFCFEQTTYCISGRIREFWSQNDGLRAFGLPVTPLREEEIEGRRLQVQWFERNRLELHPENARPSDVLIGRLGADALVQSERVWESFAKSAPQGDCRFFAETGHNICGALLRAWRAQGIEIDGQAGKSEAENLALFGLPLSGPRTETLSDGRAYTVQWFERARFEIHTEFSPPNDILLGLRRCAAVPRRRYLPRLVYLQHEPQRQRADGAHPQPYPGRPGAGLLARWAADRLLRGARRWPARDLPDQP
jgi:hypothetical protein